METGNFKTRYHVMEVSSIETFMNVKGNFHHDCKDVYFLRMIGINEAMTREIQRMDQRLTEQMNQGKGFYNRIGSLPRLAAMEDAEFYAKCYEDWLRSGKKYAAVRASGQNQQLCRILGGACAEILGLLEKGKQGMNASIEKNFLVKVLFWLDQTVFSALQNWRPESSMKVACMDISRQQEYLFCYLLTLLGFDVLLLQVNQDISRELEQLGLSRKYAAAKDKRNAAAYAKRIAVPEYQPEIYGSSKSPRVSAENASSAAGKEGQPEGKSASVNVRNGKETHGGTTITAKKCAPVNVRVPERDRRTREMLDSRKKEKISGQPENRRDMTGRQEISNGRAPANHQSVSGLRRELTYEELAQLASSVVQIMIHDSRGEVIGGGSGIMIGRGGYILTNNHVACRGGLYSVRIEEDERVYQTDEMIKYNSVLDLAVLRIDRNLQPLPIYQGDKKLVRGQRVVAIGSPLGLFNSVSDGIISGFRSVEGVDMIQFTAPISNGSSGGAVLNMYGEVIGISTAGFDAGQNINLAVGYEYIGNFIRGFVN